MALLWPRELLRLERQWAVCGANDHIQMAREQERVIRTGEGVVILCPIRMKERNGKEETGRRETKGMRERQKRQRNNQST
jgi:hypothetical protein